MTPKHDLHPHWNALLQWLSTHGMNTESLRVEVRSSPGAGYGLFATETIEPSTIVLSIPSKALLNTLTLSPHYPASQPKLSCTQYVSLHLMLHRPLGNNSQSDDPLYGPFISVLPREFDSHPLTWLWKEHNHGRWAVLETQLLEALPEHIVKKLNRMHSLFTSDWKRIKDYLRENPTVAHRRSCSTHNVALWELDCLWAWLNVNTRCVYHRLAKSRSSPDNMTLCPIFDFSNHTYTGNSMHPRATKADVWDSGLSLSSKRRFGDDFVLLSPSNATVNAGEQLFLRYGMHANSTLFAEYGFVNMVDWGNLDDTFSGEVEVDHFVKTLLERKAGVGEWAKDILIKEGYWEDWTLQMLPSPPHPSYRLITALRLISPCVETLSNEDHTEIQLNEWRKTTLGTQEVISADNERLWRECLLRICEEVVIRAEEGLSKVSRVHSENSSIEWLPMVKCFMKALWQEEIHVSIAVMASLKANIEF